MTYLIRTKAPAHAFVVNRIPDQPLERAEAYRAVEVFLQRNRTMADRLDAAGLYLYQNRELECQVWMAGREIAALKIYECEGEFVAIPVAQTYQRCCYLFGTRGSMFDKDISPGLRTLEFIRIKEGDIELL